MTTWTTTAAGRSLFAELDAAFPNRDKRSDGTIASATHLANAPSSSHNPDDTPGVRTPYSDADSIPEVHADDIDADLNRPGWTLERVFEIIRRRCLLGRERRVRYLIINRKIASSSWGWVWHAYSGSDPHDTHGHVDLVYGSGTGQDNPENITAPWGILAAVLAEGDDLPSIDELLNADGIANDINPGAEGQPGYNPRMSVGWALRYASRAELARREAASANDRLGRLEEKVALLLQASAAPTPAPVQLTPEQLDSLADAVVAKLSSGVELGFRPAT